MQYIYDKDGVLTQANFPEIPGFGVQIPSNGVILEQELEQKEGYVWLYNNGNTIQVEDNRGFYYSTETGEKVSFIEFGEIPETLTKKAPNTPYDKWDGEEWVKDEDLENKDLANNILSQRDELMEKAYRKIRLYESKIKLANHNPDDDDTPEKRSLAAWETYLIALDDIIQQSNFPNDIVWPVMPE